MTDEEYEKNKGKMSPKEGTTMPDFILALTTKRSRLLARRREIENEANRQIKEIDDELEKVMSALHTVEKAAREVLCKRCGGSGTIRVCDAAGDMDDDPCPNCAGTGIDITGRLDE